MFEKLQSIEDSYLALQAKMYDPEIATDLAQSREINKKLMALEESYQLYQIYKKIMGAKIEAEELLANETDTDVIDMAKDQLQTALSELPEIEEKLKVALIPKDPNDDKNIFLEVRPGAGGDEAGLFAAELLKGYMLYAQRQGWKTEIIEQQYSDIG
jgi:peptide chain release factor 1